MNGNKSRELRKLAKLTLPTGTDEVIVRKHYRKLKTQYKQELKNKVN